MKEKRGWGFILAVILLFATLACAKSITFGSISGETDQTILRGEQDRFKVSFFNLGDHIIFVELKAVHSSDVRVEIDPPALTLKGHQTLTPDGSGGKEWFVLKDGQTYVETSPVHVYVKVGDTVTQNLYDIKLIATATTSNDAAPDTGIKQTLSQSREILFHVYVPGEVVSRESDIVETSGSDREYLVTTSTYRKPPSSTQGFISSISDVLSGSSGGGSLVRRVTDFISGSSNEPLQKDNVIIIPSTTSVSQAPGYAGEGSNSCQGNSPPPLPLLRFSNSKPPRNKGRVSPARSPARPISHEG